MKYFKLFNNYTEYKNYIYGLNPFLPNISLCKDEKRPLYYFKENKVLVKYNVTDISTSTKLFAYGSNFSAIEIDDVSHPELLTYYSQGYTFDTLGEHIVKYTLTNNTQIIGSCFGSCTNITFIRIPQTVTTIYNSAFYGCSNLTEIYLPPTITTLYSYAF